nr:hypothetical protein GCM10020092_003510 [Actinoplanes digitatis]
MRVARIAAFGIGAVAIVLSIFAQSLNVAFLVALAFAVAASGNLPSDPVQPVLEGFQHLRSAVGHLWRSDLRRGAGVLLARRLRFPDGDVPRQ